jgi:hypothetical protein
VKRLCAFTSVCLLLWGCAPSQPAGEIISAFKEFLLDVKAGNQEKILAAAPFLAPLPASQKEAALTYFRRLAALDPARLNLFVSHGAGGIWLLHISAPGERSAMVVPFRRNVQGQWEMSPVVQAIQHFDVIPRADRPQGDIR